MRLAYVWRVSFAWYCHLHGWFHRDVLEHPVGSIAGAAASAHLTSARQQALQSTACDLAPLVSTLRHVLPTSALLPSTRSNPLSLLHTAVQQDPYSPAEGVPSAVLLLPLGRVVPESLDVHFGARLAAKDFMDRCVGR